MSFHVFIARDRWKDTPILKEEWACCVRSVEGLEVKSRPSRFDPQQIEVRLKSSKKLRLRLTQGWVNAEAPNEELVRIMFQLAEKLNAKVYSQKAVPYQAVEDWKKRTKKYYEKREERLQEESGRKWITAVLFVAGVVGVIIVLFVLERLF